MANKKQPLKILIIGSLPPPIGGTTVLLLDLIHLLAERNDIQTSIVNTSKKSPGVFGNIECILRTLWQVIQKGRNVDNFRVIKSVQTLSEALELEQLLHSLGYEGYHSKGR